MTKKIGSALEKHKYAISIFLFFIIYNFVVVGNFSFPTINSFTYTIHIVDYTIGFCSKLLPGAIYNAFFSTTNPNVVNLYVVILYYLFLLSISIMLEKFLYKFDSENRLIAFIIVLFFITGPVTFSLTTFGLGVLDTYWLFFTAAFLIIVKNKYLKWFVPIIFVLSLFIHVSAIMSFIPFFSLVVLLEASRSKKDRKSYVVIFTVSILLTVATFLYFLIFEKNNLTLSLDAFRSFISKRNLSEWADYPDYYEYALYNRSYVDGAEMVSFVSDGESGFISKIFGSFLTQIYEIYRTYPKINRNYYIGAVKGIFISIPIVVLLYKYVLSAFKKEKSNKLRRFVWFCALFLLPFAFVVTSAFFSPDLIRWFAHGVTLLFTLIIYETYRSSDIDYLTALNKHFNPSSYFAVIIYFLLYMTCTVNPFWSLVAG